MKVQVHAKGNLKGSGDAALSIHVRGVESLSNQLIVQMWEHRAHKRVHLLLGHPTYDTRGSLEDPRGADIHVGYKGQTRMKTSSKLHANSGEQNINVEYM